MCNFQFLISLRRSTTEYTRVPLCTCARHVLYLIISQVSLTFMLVAKCMALISGTGSQTIVFTQMYKRVPGYRRLWKCEWKIIVSQRNLHELVITKIFIIIRDFLKL